MPKICLLKLQTKFKITPKDGRCLGILGSHEITGAWDESRPIFASEIGEDKWEASFRMISGTRLEWKWVVYDTLSNNVVQWEVRENRTLIVPEICSLISTQFDGEQCDIISQKEGIVESTNSMKTSSFLSLEESDQRGTSRSSESRDEICDALPSSKMSETSSEKGNQILLNSHVNAAEDINMLDLRAAITKENEFVSMTTDEAEEKEKYVAAIPEIYFEKFDVVGNGHTKESTSNIWNEKEQTEMHRMNDKKISDEKESNIQASGNKYIPITPNTSVEMRKMNQSAPIVIKKNESSVLLRDTQIHAASKMYTERETMVSPTRELSHETDKQFKLHVLAKPHVSTHPILVSYVNKATEIVSDIPVGIGEGVSSVTAGSNGSGDSFSRGSKENSHKTEMFPTVKRGKTTEYSRATQTSPKAREDNIASANSTQISPSIDMDEKGIKSEQFGHWSFDWSSSLLLVNVAILATAALTYIIYRKSH